MLPADLVVNPPSGRRLRIRPHVDGMPCRNVQSQGSLGGEERIGVIIGHASTSRLRQSWRFRGDGLIPVLVPQLCRSSLHVEVVCRRMPTEDGRVDDRRGAGARVDTPPLASVSQSSLHFRAGISSRRSAGRRCSWLWGLAHSHGLVMSPWTSRSRPELEAVGVQQVFRGSGVAPGVERRAATMPS